jgi:predicted outer membrane lipoprotein
METIEFLLNLGLVIAAAIGVVTICAFTVILTFWADHREKEKDIYRKACKEKHGINPTPKMPPTIDTDRQIRYKYPKQ